MFHTHAKLAKGKHYEGGEIASCTSKCLDSTPQYAWKNDHSLGLCEKMSTPTLMIYRHVMRVSC